MGRDGRATGRMLCVAVAFVGVSTGAWCGGQPWGKAVSTESEAVALASAYTGLSQELAAAAERREVTDSSAPVFELQQRAVWEVVFQGVRIAVPDWEGQERENPNTDTISVWLDAQTGALVKAFTPKPAEGGLTLKVGERERELLAGNGLVLREHSTPPAKVLVPALALAERELKGQVVHAKEIVAYYGLMTDRLDIERKMIDRPAWCIYLGGIARPFSSGGPFGAPPAAPATEALVVLDATTGEWHRTFLAGKDL